MGEISRDGRESIKIRANGSQSGSGSLQFQTGWIISQGSNWNMLSLSSLRLKRGEKMGLLTNSSTRDWFGDGACMGWWGELLYKLNGGDAHITEPYKWGHKGGG